jgi:predicted kinase
VRECHGDLHLGNIVRIGGRLLPFDALEFDPALRWIDVLSEAAFLVMDLESHDFRELAFEFLNRYLDSGGDHEGLPLLPLFLSHRALVRAKVKALSPPAKSEGTQSMIVRLLDYAASPLPGLRPALVVMCGISGSGKSWRAKRLSTELPAIHLRSDLERKRLFGLDALAASGSAFGQGLYSRDASARTYARLAELARVTLDAGLPVIIDATNLRREHREPFVAIARATARPVAIVVCEADRSTLEERIRDRQRSGTDPSEAGIAVAERQSLEFERPMPDEADAVITCSAGNEEAHRLAVAQLRVLMAREIAGHQ